MIKWKRYHWKVWVWLLQNVAPSKHCCRLKYKIAYIYIASKLNTYILDTSELHTHTRCTWYHITSHLYNCCMSHHLASYHSTSSLSKQPTQWLHLNLPHKWCRWYYIISSLPKHGQKLICIHLMAMSCCILQMKICSIEDVPTSDCMYIIYLTVKWNALFIGEKRKKMLYSWKDHQKSSW